MSPNSSTLPLECQEVAYARGDCRVIRERVVTPYGRVIYRSREICY